MNKIATDNKLSINNRKIELSKEQTNSIRAIFKGTKNQHDELKNSKCILPISVGQSYHESSKFEATISLINKKFKECIIIVCDSLQRHTIQFLTQLNSVEAKRESLRLGDEWLNRNKKYFSNFTIPYTVDRWNNWLYSSEYKKFRVKVNLLYITDPIYYALVNKTAHSFVRRYFEADKLYSDNKRALQLSIDYLLEECSIMPLWSKLHAGFEVYPSNRLVTMQYVYNKFVVPLNPKNLRYLRVNFETIYNENKSIIT